MTYQTYILFINLPLRLFRCKCFIGQVSHQVSSVSVFPMQRFRYQVLLVHGIQVSYKPQFGLYSTLFTQPRAIWPLVSV